MTMTLHKDITELIGRTPLVRLNRLSPAGGATIYGKVEFFNPGGSVKDRICLNMINEAERLGEVKAWRHDRRADQWKHRDRTGIGRRGPWV